MSSVFCLHRKKRLPFFGEPVNLYFARFLSPRIIRPSMPALKRSTRQGIQMPRLPVGGVTDSFTSDDAGGSADSSEDVSTVAFFFHCAVNTVSFCTCPFTSGDQPLKMYPSRSGVPTNAGMPRPDSRPSYT